MPSFVAMLCKSLAGTLCCCKCFKTKSAHPTQEIGRFERVYPSISQETRLTFYTHNDDQFIHIPHETDIDKIINYHKDATKLSEEDAAQIEAYFIELKQLYAKYSKGSNPLMSQRYEHPGAFSMRLSDEQGATLAIDKANIQWKKAPHLAIDIQKGRFFWPEELKKLDGPFVRVRMVRIKPSTMRSSHEISKNAEVLKMYETFPAEDIVNPQWNQAFVHTFNEDEFMHSLSENENLQNEIIGFQVSLLYQKENADQVQIGSEQTFFLRELIDQQMKTKEVAFKHGKSMGLIAKISIRVQFVHDELALKKAVSQSIEYRIGQISAIKKKHPDVFKLVRRNTMASSMNDRESVRDIGSPDGSYSFETGLNFT